MEKLNNGEMNEPKTNPHFKALGERIRIALKAEGQTQAALSDHVGVDRTTVSHWLAGRHSPRPDQVALIAKFLHTTTDFLLGLEKEDWFYKLDPEIKEFVRSEVASGKPLYLKVAHKARKEGLSVEGMEAIADALRRSREK